MIKLQGKGPFYYFEELINDYGTGYGSIRHEVAGESTEEAVSNLANYFRKLLPKGKAVLGGEWASDIRGKSPEEAARIRLTTDNGDSEESPWGFGGDVWSQEQAGAMIS